MPGRRSRVKAESASSPVRLSHPGPAYRPEIDGLRAVAVVSVILYHAGVGLFSGGFVGVDVFFTISGFLITSILTAELGGGTFSLAAFYERRVRRIFPALFFVMACCIPFAWAWLLPSQLDDFGKSLVAVPLFAANVLFWREQGYFAADTALKPLMHTWSLSVEEQFYCVFPILLLLGWKLCGATDARQRARRLMWMLGGLALASLALSEWGWRHASEANFYLAPGRAWELLAGAMCALRVGGGERPNAILGAGGIALIMFAVVAFDSSTPMPSLYGLAPVGGTVLVILYGGGTSWAARLLGCGACRGVGLISYSAYLWHQPLFAFARIRNVAEPGMGLMLALSALALVLGWISWWLIEQPFRRRREGGLLPTRRGVFVAAVLVAGAFMAVGGVLHGAKGFPQRPLASGTMGQLERRAEINFGLSSDCEGEFTLSPRCATAARPTVLLWGDSFAMHLAPGIVASDPRIALRQHTISDCVPILGLAIVGQGKDFDAAEARHCIAFNARVLAWLKANPSVRTVILSSPFTMFRDQVMLEDGTRSAATPDLLAPALVRTAEAIRASGAKVVVMSPTPIDGTNMGQCLLRATLFGAPSKSCNFSENAAAAHGYPEALMERVSAKVPVVRLDHMICTAGRCRTMMDGHLLYRDSGHLSIEGGRFLGMRFHWADLLRSAAR